MVGARSAGSALRNPQPSSSKRPRASQAPESSSKKSKPPVATVPETSIASALTDVPAELTLGEDVDYGDAQKIYEKFWTECQDCFVFETVTKYKINISKLEPAPADWTI